MQNKNIAVLGSTGSIGAQALDVVRMSGFNVTALAAGKNIKLLEEEIREFKPKLAGVADEKAAKELRARVRDINVKIVAGKEAVLEAAAFRENDIVLNSVVGIAGLAPTMAAINANKTLALANKESLVAAGDIVMGEAKKRGVAVLPVDSEHSAIFQSLQGSRDKARELKKIILTASGGPFFGKTAEALKKVTVKEALHNPNWSMGAKITVDSSTLMNKGLELVEAVKLFHIPPEQVEIVVHRQSILHSAVEFCDGAVIAELGVPDMRIPIQYALTYPYRYPSPAKSLDIFKMGALTFEKPDLKTFKCLDVMIKAAKKGGLTTAAANGANEQAVAFFLDGKISFTDIGDLVESAANKDYGSEITLGAVYETDRKARELVCELVKSL